MFDELPFTKLLPIILVEKTDCYTTTDLTSGKGTPQ
jgi:hypothetical protein